MMSDCPIQANADVKFESPDVGLINGADSRASPRTVRLSIEKPDLHCLARFR